MALVTEAPKDLPEADPDVLKDLLNPPRERERAEIYLSGAHVATVDRAPLGRERITMMVELEVTEESIRFNENDGEIPIRRCRRVGDMWPVGTPKPLPKKSKAEQDAEAEAAAAENQPALFDDGDDLDTADDESDDGGDQADDDAEAVDHDYDPFDAG